MTASPDDYAADSGDIDRLRDIYRREGFVAARGLLTPEEVSRFRPILDAAMADRTSLDARGFNERSPYEQSLRQCIHMWVDHPDVRPLTFHQRIAGMAAALLGTDCLRLWHDQALYKEPGDRATDAHQDHAYWPVVEPDLVTAWIPLVDVDETNGCMGYMPRTQNDAREFVNIFTAPGAGDRFAARHEAPVFMPARAGDVIFHAARTAHLAGANRSGGVRAVHTVVYFRDGCTRSEGAGQDAPDAIDGKVGEPIRGPSTPIAWPLAPGAWPAPPPWRQPTRLHKTLAARGMLPAESRP